MKKIRPGFTLSSAPEGKKFSPAVTADLQAGTYDGMRTIETRMLHILL